MEIAYLGPPIDYYVVFKQTLGKLGKHLSYIPDYLSWKNARPSDRSGPGSQIANRLGRIRSQLTGTYDHDYLEAALAIIDERQVDTIWAFWGTLPLADLKAIKKLRPRVHLALHLLCHPLGLKPARVWLQNLLLANSLNSVDTIVVSNSIMKSYLRNRIVGAKKKAIHTIPPCWSEEYAPALSLPPIAESPNILFAGRMDWKTGQPSDNVIGQLSELMREGIQVHYCRSPESSIDLANAHPFDAVPLRDFAHFAAPFDASLILYNLDQVTVTDRFENTVPERLISSVSAGVPVAMPRNGYSGCREYLSSYRAVIDYDSIPHLAEQLRDRNRIQELRAMARTDCSHYRVEKHLQQLLDLS